MRWWTKCSLFHQQHHYLKGCPIGRVISFYLSIWFNSSTQYTSHHYMDSWFYSFTLFCIVFFTRPHMHMHMQKVHRHKHSTTYTLYFVWLSGIKSKQQRQQQPQQRQQTHHIYRAVRFDNNANQIAFGAISQQNVNTFEVEKNNALQHTQTPYRLYSATIIDN